MSQLLRQTRLNKNLGLRASAKKIGISPSYLCRIELGYEATPSSSIIVKIASFYDLDIDIVFSAFNRRVHPDIEDAYFKNDVYQQKVPIFVRLIGDMDLSETEFDEIIRRIKQWRVA